MVAMLAAQRRLAHGTAHQALCLASSPHAKLSRTLVLFRDLAVLSTAAASADEAESQADGRGRSKAGPEEEQENMYYFN